MTIFLILAARNLSLKWWTMKIRWPINVLKHTQQQVFLQENNKNYIKWYVFMDIFSWRKRNSNFEVLFNLILIGRNKISTPILFFSQFIVFRIKQLVWKNHKIDEKTEHFELLPLSKESFLSTTYGFFGFADSRNFLNLVYILMYTLTTDENIRTGRKFEDRFEVKIEKIAYPDDYFDSFRGWKR